MIRMLLLAGLWIAVICVCVTAQEGKTARGRAETRVFRHYAIDIPYGLAIERVDAPLMDFDLYRVVTKTKGNILGELFFGNHPVFPQLLWSRMANEKKEKSKTTKEFPFDADHGQMEGKICFSGLTDKENLYSAWACVYYNATGINSEEAAKMNELIQSVRVVKPHLD
jgi:hypothetical protein